MNSHDDWTANFPMNHPHHPDVTTETALDIARNLKYGPLPKASDPKPSINESIGLINRERKACGFDWITGELSEEVLRLSRGEMVVL